MANSSALRSSSLITPILLLLILANALLHTEVEAQIGVCYGMLGRNLLSRQDVVALSLQNNIQRMRIYSPDEPTLTALGETGIQLMLGLLNSDLQSIASSQANADNWVQKNFVNHVDVNFRYIAVGNERSVSPLLVNIYPYSAYLYNQQSISLSYVLFTSSSTVVTDPNNGLRYQNLFDAMYDSVVAALEKIGARSLGVVVSESGWPSAGGTATMVDNARTYNTNLVAHVKNGTPKRRGNLETYIFAMFDEDQKSPDYEKNWGLFLPNKQPKYRINFN
ncbi:hypothetical protein MLD38_034530 [Melastoma candidum]|uniref:Uncharacterized protein n=1 Tax=Melastoma candidum TaxID=119954 RepID=A0ACB9MEA1_9MYRT|nr:hypothetical protein MLD38_034530 [Melastoma candidum]